MSNCVLINILIFFGIFLLIENSDGQCTLGKWGGTCQYNCSDNCYHGNECTTNINICGCDQSTGKCNGCTKDFYGEFCRDECNANCSLSDQCLQSGIGCGCHIQYGECNSCPKSLWGRYCERSCSSKCINSECGRDVGNCSLGCVSGFYGSSCTLSCPTSCQYGCDQETGTCFPEFCVNCLGGLPNCDRNAKKCKSGCIDGFYGERCDKTCAEITNLTLCTKCVSLSAVGITICSECQSGYYSDAVLNQCALCSTGCKINSTTVAKCFPDNGNCRFGCTSGWNGERCDTFNCAVENCETCVPNQPAMCESCKNGWYLESGQCVRCSDNCNSQNDCDKISGTCTSGCKTGWYGNRCTDSCIPTCQQGQCDNTGVCTIGCNGKRYGQKCDLSCSNCLTSCNRNSGICDSSCMTGYHGQDCLQSCPINCASAQCNQIDGKCTSGCKSGFYGTSCGIPCGSSCIGSVCDFVDGKCAGDCSPGKYGDYCDLDCPIHCSPRTCLKIGGSCSALCENGFYGSHCNIPCPTSCSTNECNKNDGTCSTNCPNGKFGTRCELSCSSHCNETSCDQASGACRNGCKPGYYGDTCQETCSRCDSSGCNRINGDCIGKCINGYYGSKCDQPCAIGCSSLSCDKMAGICSLCKDGFYGNNCSQTCSSNCWLTKCNKTTGLCSDGCIAGHFGQSCDINCVDCTVCDQNTGSCQGCVPGKYGTNCDKDCSVNCVTSTTGKSLCDNVDGYCLNGCATGWYGSLCNVPCNNNIHCIGNSCHRHTGECSGNCVSGWYGVKCEKQCSNNCEANLCDRTFGNCTQSCQLGYYGAYCTTPCKSTCTDCDVVSGTCTKCKTGYYGDECEKTCSNHCALLITGLQNNDICNKDTGICNGGCQDGWYGQTCLNECSQNCKENKCAADTGKCLTGCKSNTYGEFCENRCPNCGGTSPNNCDITGRCIFGCVDGFYGSFCSQSCFSGCKNQKCYQTMNNCTSGCQSGLFGASCSLACNARCLNDVCDQNTGNCIDGCDNGWFGEKCKYACPDYCAGGFCDRVAGTCVDVCTGNKCEGTTIRDETEVDLAIIIGASVAGAVALIMILIIICCHCLRTRNQRKGGSEDVLTKRSDSLTGIDNQQFENFPNFDEIKKDDWVLRNTLRYEQPKQNGVLRVIDEADAQIDYYEFPPPPTHDFQSDDDSGSQENRVVTSVIDFEYVDGRNGIQVEMLPQYVAYMLQKENAFENQYNELPYGLKHPHDVALKPGNKNKNRYKNIYAYDHSRVVLVPELESDDDNSSIVKHENTDYINASYFDGYHQRNAYISCQGPTDEMVNDFWRMVWQLRIQNIVMLTNLVEAGQVKCKKYWPEENRTDKYGNIYVRFDYQEIFADFILTNLIVTKQATDDQEEEENDEDNARLQVKHLQFTSWPDKDVPKYVTPLVEFYCKVKSGHREGPLLVHCSAGVGRSGTFIGLDYLIDQADAEGRVNIYRCVDNMRIARPNMVQTVDQYIFLHQALSEALLTSESPVDEDEFENYYNQMQIKDPRSGLARLQYEFSQIKTQKVQNMYESAKLEENKHRNRQKKILASDECRVFLWSKIKGCTDYINAIYLPSYRNKYCFIATEMPQCSTIVDFCRMIFQEEVRTIINLDNESSGINTNDHYWPNQNETMVDGPFSINITDQKDHKDYVVRSLNFKFSVDPESKSEMLNVLDQNGTYKVNQFHYKRWSEGKVTPASVDSFLHFVKAVSSWQSDSVKHPIIVHCLDGASKVGLLCLLKVCLDRLQSDGDVSVVHALHHMKARRHQLVPNYEQYKFCHDCILKHVTSADL